MVFQPDGFYNLPAISSSIKLRRDLCLCVSVHMAVLLVTSNKLITLLEPCSHSLGSPGVALAERGWLGVCSQPVPVGSCWQQELSVSQLLSMAVQVAAAAGSV